MDIQTQSALLAAIVGVALGLSMLLRRARPRQVTLFGILALNVGGFYAAAFVHRLLDAASAEWPARIALGVVLLLASLLPVLAVAFFLEFLGIPPTRARRVRRWVLWSPVLGLVVALTPLGGGMGGQIAVASAVFLALLVALWLLVGRIRQTRSPVDRQRLAYVATAAAAAVLFSALDFLALLHVPWPHLGPIFTSLFLFFLTQTLLRSRLLDLNEFLGRVASHTMLAAVIGAVFIVLTAWVPASNRGLYFFNTAVAAFVIITLLEPLRTLVEDRIIAAFFRERQALRMSLQGLLERMSGVIEVPALTSLVLDALNETRRITHTSIYLLAEDRPGYRLRDFRGPRPAERLDAAAGRVMVAAAEDGQRSILLENLGRRAVDVRSQLADGRPVREALRQLGDMRAALQQMKAGLCLPLLGKDGTVLGFLNLWDERVAESYGSDEIVLLVEVADAISVAVENSRLYEQMRERDRLAALGEMAAGLAHEIRNPLGAIKGASQCLTPGALSSEDAEFMAVIQEEVDRLNGVVSAFLDYARPMKQSFGPTDLNEVVLRSHRLFQNALPAQLQVRLELTDELPPVSGDPEHLKQVLLNLVQNAIQAIGPGRGTLTVITRRAPKLGAGPAGVELLVRDSGPGIPTDQQVHLFVPFFTTKEKGTGLGLAICQRIVRHHGGSISVRSQSGQGTTFIIRLPVLSAGHGAEDLRTADLPVKVTPPLKTGGRSRRKRARRAKS